MNRKLLFVIACYLFACAVAFFGCAEASHHFYHHSTQVTVFNGKPYNPKDLPQNEGACGTAVHCAV